MSYENYAQQACRRFGLAVHFDYSNTLMVNVYECTHQTGNAKRF